MKNIKKCTGPCGKEKTLACFSIGRNKCKDCRSEQNKILYQKNREDIINYQKNRYQENKEDILEYQKEYYELNKEKIIANHREYYEEYKEKILIKGKKKRATKEFKEKDLIYKKEYNISHIKEKSEYNKKYRLKNKEKIYINQKAWINKNKEKVAINLKEYQNINKDKLNKQANKRKKDRRKVDINFKIKELVSSSISRFFKSWKLSKSGKSSWKYLSYTPNEFRLYIESLFEPWMTWKNHGNYRVKSWNDNDSSTWTWQIDHIIPHSLFKYENMECKEFRKCWALDNLRPYSAKQNWLDGTSRVRHK